jgi:hypothetical protein
MRAVPLDLPFPFSSLLPVLLCHYPLPPPRRFARGDSVPVESAAPIAVAELLRWMRPFVGLANRKALLELAAHSPQLFAQEVLRRCKSLRIVTRGISGGRALTGPLRDARRFPSTRWYPVPGATRTTLWLSIVQGAFSVAQCPNITIRNFFTAVGARDHPALAARAGGARRTA